MEVEKSRMKQITVKVLKETGKKAFAVSSGQKSKRLGCENTGKYLKEGVGKEKVG